MEWVKLLSCIFSAKTHLAASSPRDVRTKRTLGCSEVCVKHSEAEQRFHALGKTDEGRTLHITFTLRNSGRRIRVISAGDMHKKERTIYEQAT